MTHREAARRSKKVLLIDDDPVVISLYTALFRHNGCEVVSAADGDEGLTCLRRSAPDAVLLDLAMPKVNGLEWLRRVRAEQPHSAVPVLILTTSELGLTAQAAKNAGAVAVLSKYRFDPDKVVAAVMAALDGSAASG